jgi:nitrogen regulatory protein PII
MKLVILITSRLGDTHTVGEAWQQAGAPGVTLIESFGLRRIQEASKSLEVLPGMMSLMEILRENDEIKSATMLSVVDDQHVDAIIRSTESILGDLNVPNNGVLFVIDIERAVGVRDHRHSSR